MKRHVLDLARLSFMLERKMLDLFVVVAELAAQLYANGLGDMKPMAL